MKQRDGLLISKYKIPTFYHHTQTNTATTTHTTMYQSMATPYSDSTSAYETHGPANRLDHLVTTYGVSVLHRSPIFQFRERVGLRAQVCAALLVCLALIISVYVTFGYSVYSYGYLGDEAADDVMVFLLIVVNVFLWTMAGILWKTNSRREVSGIRRHLYMLVGPHVARGEESADEEVLVVERQDMV